MKNVYIDGVRRARSSPISGTQLALEGVEDREPLLLGDRELEQLRRVVARDIEAALDKLSPESKLIVLLDLEGLSEREIADAMDCAQGTVKSRLSRARAQLRALLGGYAP
jgi:RNA polymerase sigma-70 factor (ECF subfamily)